MTYHIPAIARTQETIRIFSVDWNIRTDFMAANDPVL